MNRCFFWQRRFEALCHEVRITAPQYVKPFLEHRKNVRNEAEAICTALRQPNDTEAAFVGLSRDRLVMADIFHLFRYNIVAGDMGDIPSVPDEAANGEHRDSVTQCVTKSRRGSDRAG